MKEAQANLFLRIMHNHSRDLTPFIHELRELKKHSKVELVKYPILWSAVLYWGATKEGHEFWFKACIEDGWERKAARKKILQVLLSVSRTKPSEDYL